MCGRSSLYRHTYNPKMAVIQSVVQYLLIFVFSIQGLIGLLISILRHPLTFYKKKTRNVPPACLMDPSYGTHEYITANGIKFHCVCKGDTNKPLMVFLHGFPEFWYSWRYQLKYFCNDYRVMAIDLRGYGDTDKPAGKENYMMDILKEDVVQLIKVVSPSKKCILVGHDWGGVIGWSVVQDHPELIDKYIVMNAPHVKVMSGLLRKSTKQLLKSWYVFMFQSPYIPEWLMSMNDMEMFKFTQSSGIWWDVFTFYIITSRSRVKELVSLVHGENFTDDDIEAYKYTFGQIGAMTPPINYYRNMFSRLPKKPFKLINTPTLVLWGANDVAFEESLAHSHVDICTDITIKVIPDCSHWTQQDCPETVNEHMKEFLK